MSGPSAASGGDFNGKLADVFAALDRKAIQVSQASRDDLCGFSVLQGAAADSKRSLISAALAEGGELGVSDRVMGSMCGMAVGDSLGHNFEFQPVQDSYGPQDPHFDLETLKFHGASNSFGLKPGQWTDDASMGLCMADSLILCGGYDGSDMRVRFWCWWNRGYNNAFGKDPGRSSSVGLGGNISKSLSNVGAHARRGEAVPPIYNADGEDAGNGSLMRYTPIAICLHATPMQEVHQLSRMSSYTTHPGIIAAEACSLLGHLIVRAINLPSGVKVDPKAFLERETADYYESSGLSGKSGWGYDQMKWLVTSTPVHDTERCWTWKSEFLDVAGTLRARGHSYNGYPVSAGYFGSYSLDGLALALWSIYHTTSFNEAVTKSINLLGDADSHGSITGQLAGALYGYSSIHPRFIEELSRWDDYEFAVRALLLHRLGAERALQTVPAACSASAAATPSTATPSEADNGQQATPAAPSTATPSVAGDG